MVKQKNNNGVNETYSPSEREVLSKSLKRMFKNTRKEGLYRYGEFGVTDSECVCAVIAVSDRAKVLLSFFIEVAVPGCSNPALSYGHVPGKVKISSSYLLWAVTFLKKCDEKICIEAEKDYPIRLSCEDWQIIIAPRVTNEL
jgi:hypothetical protein